MEIEVDLREERIAIFLAILGKEIEVGSKCAKEILQIKTLTSSWKEKRGKKESQLQRSNLELLLISSLLRLPLSLCLLFLFIAARFNRNLSYSLILFVLGSLFMRQ